VTQQRQEHTYVQAPTYCARGPENPTTYNLEQERNLEERADDYLDKFMKGDYIEEGPEPLKERAPPQHLEDPYGRLSAHRGYGSGGVITG